MSINLVLTLCLVAVLMAVGDVAAKPASQARPGGVRGDGVTDDTAAIQKALNAGGKIGGVVCLPAGKYLVKGSLAIPPGVSLKGVGQAPQFDPPILGTVITATGGRDKEDGPSLFELGDSSSVVGLTVFYPEQKIADVHPYPYTFHLKGMDNTVQNVTLVNAYNAIRVGPEPNGRHRIKSVYGCALHRGIYVDYCVDIGKIEDVHFHCHWFQSKDVGGDPQMVYDYMWKNFEAFTFGRSDWQYVTNTFVFPAKVGYRFIATEHGSMNGQFSGAAADATQKAVIVEQVQPMGVLITNGQFVTSNGDNQVELTVQTTCTGSVRLVNCSFWGTAIHNVVSHSSGFLSLSSCYLSSWRPSDNPTTLVEADNGRLQITNCTFGTDQPSVLLKKGLKHAVVTQNNGNSGVGIVNETGELAVISGNEERK
jgi:hypothetical protein